MEEGRFVRGDGRKEHIFLTALELFTRRGFGVKISEIAQAAGISQGLMYRYYASKSALIEEIACVAAESALQGTIKLFGVPGNAWEKITAASEQMARAICEDGPTALFFMFMVQIATTEPVPANVRMSLARMSEPIAHLAQIIERGQAEGSVRAGDPMQLANLYWAAVQGLCCIRIAGSAVPIGPKVLGGILLKE